VRDTEAVLFGLIFLAIGGRLFSGDISRPDTNQSAYIVGGAAFLSLGLLNLWFALKNRLKWKREYKEYRNE
jgi:hypothetical protein